jgi:hypothetical protein
MGAHTTSWIVHLDRVRRALVGKPVAAAATALAGEVLNEARATRAQLEPQFAIRGNHRAALDAAAAEATTATAAAQAASPQTQPALLQAAVNAVLTFINYIPGATLEAADTGGKTEGLHRGILQRAEGGEAIRPLLLRTSILDLLDVKAASVDQRAHLIDNHLKTIQATYPIAYARSQPTQLAKLAASYLDDRDDGDGKKRTRQPARRGHEADPDEERLGAKRPRDGDPAATPAFAFNFAAFGVGSSSTPPAEAHASIAPVAPASSGSANPDDMITD